MCFLWRSPITRSPEFTSGDFIFNPVIADSGMLEIGTRQLNNWRLHELPDFLPFCQPGALSTRLYCSWTPRHHFRLPGRYTSSLVLSEDLSSEKTRRVTSTPVYVALTQNSKRLTFCFPDAPPNPSPIARHVASSTVTFSYRLRFPNPFRKNS